MIFEKVSYDQFYEDMVKHHTPITEDGVLDIYNGIKIPKRATTGSAGYDFYAPFGFTLYPNDDITIPTGIRWVNKSEDPLYCVLALAPRSGLGFKYYTRLANTIGYIDVDYAESDNEGHIMIKLRNEGDKTLAIHQGDGIAQGVMIPFYITDDDDASGIRNGGFGSTDGGN